MLPRGVCVFVYLSFILNLLHNVAGEEDSSWQLRPQQIHLALGENPDEMVVMWATEKEAESKVVYGRHPYDFNQVEGSSEEFVNEGFTKRKEWFHKVTLKGLEPDHKYWYRCGGEDSVSDTFIFRTLPEGTDWSVNLAVYGDLGLINAQSLPRLAAEVWNDEYHAILHVGDFAYDMPSVNGRFGDGFMNLIQPLAANLPYMTCNGNHENSANFSQYKHRFSMPGDDKKMYYSFNMGPVHFISLSTEYYFFTQYGTDLIINQYNWLAEDLKEATKPENREKRPWIIVFSHRPMYCSNLSDQECTGVNPLRVGIPDIGGYGIEKLMNDYGVDLGIWAHEHSYERTYPVYNGTVYKDDPEPYTNPKAMPHIVTGSAGCTERHDPFQEEVPDFSAFRSVDYGYTRMYVHNKTHIYMEQVSDDAKGDVIDSVWLIREEHKAYTLG